MNESEFIKEYNISTNNGDPEREKFDKSLAFLIFLVEGLEGKDGEGQALKDLILYSINRLSFIYVETFKLTGGICGIERLENPSFKELADYTHLAKLHLAKLQTHYNKQKAYGKDSRMVKDMLVFLTETQMHYVANLKQFDQIDNIVKNSNGNPTAGDIVKIKKLRKTMLTHPLTPRGGRPKEGY